MYRKFGKRIIDYGIALTGIVILSPIFLILIVILAIDLRGNPFYIQNRPGFSTKNFNLIKFRSMKNLYDHNGVLLANNMRITNIGRIIRKLSLDELPQLFNVVKGEMSIVGPRPLLAKYLPLYTPSQKRRHQVLPGITGWAQVNGRNAISWTEKFELDNFYIDHISFQIDMKIILLTIKKVILSEGINNSNLEMMPPFNGKN